MYLFLPLVCKLQALRWIQDERVRCMAKLKILLLSVLERNNCVSTFDPY